jgi:hypothetical protein
MVIAVLVAQEEVTLELEQQAHQDRVITAVQYLPETMKGHEAVAAAVEQAQ